MDAKLIKSLIKMVEESDIGSLEVSGWSGKVKITPKGVVSTTETAAVQQVATAPVAAPAVAAPVAASAAAVQPEETETSNLVEVKAPMVGTFYSAASPDSAAYVSLNEKITTGQVVCIVEAMKLMNEIEAEVSGRVTKICVENAQPVEFGQVLFLVDPTG